MFMKKTKKEVLVKEGKLRSGIFMIAVMLLVLMGCATIGKPSAHALEPKLLWEKEIKDEEGKLVYVIFADKSGDTLIHRKDDRELIVYDKDGNERFHWGPRIDINPVIAEISSDGRYVAFTSVFTRSYAIQRGTTVYSGSRVHLYDVKSGKELWSLDEYSDDIRFSPDGTYILTELSEQELSIRDINSGKVLYKYEGEDFRGTVKITPDGEYIYAVEGFVPGSGEWYILYSRTANRLWEKDYLGRLVSISDGAEYITTAPVDIVLEPEKSNNGFVLDGNGNVVLEGEGYVSGNGKRIAMADETETRILSLPGKALLKKVLVKARFAMFSHDGRYLVLRGERTDEQSESDIFVYDFADGTEWESAEGKTLLGLTRDGRYMLLSDEAGIYYYEFY